MLHNLNDDYDHDDSGGRTVRINTCTNLDSKIREERTHGERGINVMIINMMVTYKNI